MLAVFYKIKDTRESDGISILKKFMFKMRNFLHDLSELGMLFGKVDCFLLKVCVLPRPT